MKRYLLAIVVMMASLSTVAAQPPVIPDPPKPIEPRPPFPPARWHFHPTPGIFHYDSGDYLVGGTAGLSRATGLWTMSPVGGAMGSYGVDPYGGAIGGSCRKHGRLFRR